MPAGCTDPRLHDDEAPELSDPLHSRYPGEVDTLLHCSLPTRPLCWSTATSIYTSASSGHELTASVSVAVHQWVATW